MLDLAELTVEAFKPGESSIKTLDSWLKSLNLSAEMHKEAMHSLKTHLFEKLKRDEIRNEATTLVQFVLDHNFSV